MQPAYSSVTKSQKTEAVFGTLLNQATDGKKEESFSTAQKINDKPISTKSNQETYEAETAKNNFKDGNIVKKDSVDISNKLPEDAEKKIETFSDEVKASLKEKLNISEEELLQAMEKLGIDILDLTKPAEFTRLVMELMGSKDGSELLLSTDFQELLTQIEKSSVQLKEALKLTPEELEQLTKQLAEVQQKKSTETAEMQLPEEEQQTGFLVTEEQNIINQNGTNSLLAKTAEVITTVRKEETVLNEQEEQTRGLVRESFEKGNVSEEQLDNEMAENSGKQKFFSTETVEKSEDAPKNGKQQNQISFQTAVQAMESNQVTEAVQNTAHSKLDVEGILRQISQMTKISVTQAQSSIEMQLNPENLGKIYLQVVSRQGAIIAQIAAQNEAVKEVLESQIAILKDNMNQQGLKVEAIEVTIASHGFERNLEEKQGNTSKEQQEAEKSSRRSINLNNLDELEGVLTEEENLVAKMMQENGNSVDWTA